MIGCGMDQCVPWITVTTTLELVRRQVRVVAMLFVVFWNFDLASHLMTRNKGRRKVDSWIISRCRKEPDALAPTCDCTTLAAWRWAAANKQVDDC